METINVSSPTKIACQLAGTASPIGTIFSNHSLFSIQGKTYILLVEKSFDDLCLATNGVYHPNRNGTYIQIYNKASPSTPAWQADCGYSPDCIYSGQTVLFVVRNASWTPGATYYVVFSSGAASGNVFCAPESSPITGKCNRRFLIEMTYFVVVKIPISGISIFGILVCQVQQLQPQQHQQLRQ